MTAMYDTLTPLSGVGTLVCPKCQGHKARRAKACASCSYTHYNPAHQKGRVFTEEHKAKLREGRKNGSARRPLRDCLCAICGDPYQTRFPNKRYCSPRCNQRAYRQRVDGLTKRAPEERREVHSPTDFEDLCKDDRRMSMTPDCDTCAKAEPLAGYPGQYQCRAMVALSCKPGLIGRHHERKKAPCRV